MPLIDNKEQTMLQTPVCSAEDNLIQLDINGDDLLDQFQAVSYIENTKIIGSF